jgi:FtsP/CotA-like multicopper oxidase with cupredoxin domain
VVQNTLIRLYLLNMVEHDAPLTFHLHANTFDVLRDGWREHTDVVTLGIAERQILEFRYPEPGRYMFHPHQDPVAERGCMGWFEVVPA